MKPIEKGMTEAITRDGRKVTQLTWFEGLEGGYSFAGVLDGTLKVWRTDGKYHKYHDSDIDLFAPPEYEWQWLLKRRRDGFYETSVFAKSEEEALEDLTEQYEIVYQIEESKREVKE